MLIACTDPPPFRRVLIGVRVVLTGTIARAPARRVDAGQLPMGSGRVGCGNPRSKGRVRLDFSERYARWPLRCPIRQRLSTTLSGPSRLTAIWQASAVCECSAISTRFQILRQPKLRETAHLPMHRRQPYAAPAMHRASEVLGYHSTQLPSQVGPSLVVTHVPKQMFFVLPPLGITSRFPAIALGST